MYERQKTNIKCLKLYLKVRQNDEMIGSAGTSCEKFTSIFLEQIPTFYFILNVYMSAIFKKCNRGII